MGLLSSRSLKRLQELLELLNSLLLILNPSETVVEKLIDSSNISDRHGVTKVGGPLRSLKKKGVTSQEIAEKTG
ncbi:hypothetical protein P170DRAFT_437486 [Aspergillus steynii IBT 23096]|uniref:Uncharacterized protein n=1 Tax=Aspergillus steynii IBT 23096 TaxID=1392250 RepID=A0A2I2G4E4_9EURO|nr:uncharacterized protein P170DRAFT_437486 [Aspergillus steynii IBT 23096]PLB47747.1 hypothetical protein P170DRAFT_437486 [Aspergillus steynii IBT 23096]